MEKELTVSLKKELIEGFKNLSREWSYLETMKVAKKETIMANILAYFFNPKEKHKIKDTFIRALLETKQYYLYKKESKSDDEKKEYCVNTFLDAKVRTEKSTEKQKRLDILITTDKVIIAIEFKINHDLNNPLDDYIDMVNKIGKGKEKYFIVLTPYWKAPVGKAKIKSNDSKFVQVMLSHFIENVEKKLGNYWEEKKHTHQWYIYNDFIQTIKNRKIEINIIKKCSNIINNKLKSDAVEKLFFEQKGVEDDNIIIQNLIIVKKHFEEKTTKLLKLLDNDFFLVESTKEKIESAIVKKTDDNMEIKVRLNLFGWWIERWKNNEKLETKAIGNYFVDLDRLINDEWLIRNTAYNLQG